MTVSFKGSHYRISILTERLLRLEYSEENYFEDGKTQIVVNREFPTVDFKVIEDDSRLEIITDSFHLYYKKGAFSPKNLFIDTSGGRWYYGEEYENLKGTTSTLDGADGSVELENGVISKSGFAILDDSENFILNNKNEPTNRPKKEVDLYFFAHGRDYFAALKDFYLLSGKTPLLPRYALGNWWSRYWAYSGEDYLNLMDRFLSEKIPLSVSVIDMDWHQVDIPERFGNGWTGYSWNKDLFPNPTQFLSALHERGLKVPLNVHPADGIRAFEDSYPAVAKRLRLDSKLEEAAIFDIANKKFREAYFEDVHHPLEKQGVDFWWIDWQQGIKGKMFDVNPLWLLNYYHYLDINREKQGIILSRYAGPGSHRYPIGFSGDTIISWESLDFQPYFTATASNIGYSWWSHDIGGHVGGYRDEELATRWIQLGVFSPINRLHSSNNLFTGKEPWNFNQPICENMENFLRLRHKLVPYLYTMNVVTAEESIPLVLPMYYHYPFNKESYYVPNQYFFGSQMFVAPITKKTNCKYKTAKVEVWFPEGVWFDFFDKGIYKGNLKLPVYREITNIPVFVKAGAIVPLDHQVALTGTPLPKTIDWHIFPGESNSFSLIEDNENKQRSITTLDLNWKNGTVKLTITGDESILPTNRQHRLIFHHLRQEDKLLDNLNQEITFKKNISFNFDSDKLLFNCLNTAEISYDLKSHLWYQLHEDANEIERLIQLNKIDEELRLRISELLYVKRFMSEFSC